MVCQCCFGLIAKSKPHPTKSSCDLLLAIGQGKCFDCGSNLPCKDKQCLSRTHSLLAVWAILRDKALFKTVEDARKAYGILDPIYDGPGVRIKEKDVWIPAHISSASQQGSFFLLKGVPIPSIFGDFASVSGYLSEGVVMRVLASFEAAIFQLFVEDVVLAGEEKSKSTEENSTPILEELPVASSKELIEAQKKLEVQELQIKELQAKIKSSDDVIPTLKDIRETDKDIARLLKASHPMAGAVEALLKADAGSFSNSLNASTPLLKGTNSYKDLTGVSFLVKNYVRDGKENSCQLELKDGSIQIIKKRKKVRGVVFS